MMKKNKQNIDQFLKEELSNLSVQNTPGNSMLFSLRMVWNNFLHFSIFSFNIYYFTILLILGSLLLYNRISDSESKAKPTEIIEEKHIINETIKSHSLPPSSDSSRSRVNINNNTFKLDTPLSESKKQVIQKNSKTVKKITKTDSSKTYIDKEAIVTVDTIKQPIFEQETQTTTKPLNDSLFKDTIKTDSPENIDLPIVIKDSITEVIKSKKRKKRRR